MAGINESVGNLSEESAVRMTELWIVHEYFVRVHKKKRSKDEEEKPHSSSSLTICEVHVFLSTGLKLIRDGHSNVHAPNVATCVGKTQKRRDIMSRITDHQTW